MITKTKAIETATADAKKVEAVTAQKTIEGVKEVAAVATAGFEQAQVQMKEGVQRAAGRAGCPVQPGQCRSFREVEPDPGVRLAGPLKTVRRERQGVAGRIDHHFQGAVLREVAQGSLRPANQFRPRFAGESGERERQDHRAFSEGRRAGFRTDLRARERGCRDVLRLKIRPGVLARIDGSAQ